MAIDYNAIRARLTDLKVKSKLKNFGFCQIYAPEKCKKSQAAAENYISAILTGRNYPKDTNGPAEIKLDHLQNLVDSGRFPGLTINYLLYGSDSAMTEKQVLDLDYHHWTLADLCEFILGLIQEYYTETKIVIGDMEKVSDLPFPDENEMDETVYYLTLKFLEMNMLSDEGCDLGIGLRTFLEEYQKCQSITSSKAKEVAIKALMNAIKSDARFNSFHLDDYHTEKIFIEHGDFGPEIEKLKIE